MPRAEETQGIQFHTLCLRQSPHRGAGFIGALLACSLVSCTALLTVLPLCSANKMLCFAVSAHLVLAGCSCAAFCSCSLSKANSKAGRESKSWSWACLRCWVRYLVPMPWVSEWALLVSWELGDEIFFVSWMQREDWSHACKNLSSFWSVWWMYASCLCLTCSEADL